MDPLRNGNNCEEDSQCAEVEEEQVDPRIQVSIFYLFKLDPDVATSESDIEMKMGSPVKSSQVVCNRLLFKPYIQWNLHSQ